MTEGISAPDTIEDGSSEGLIDARTDWNQSSESTPPLEMASTSVPIAQTVLAVDVGGTNLKVKRSGGAEVRKTPSGREMSAERMVDAVKALTADWDYEGLSIGVPAPVIHGRIAAEPINLGPGWVGIDFAQAFGKPVKIINDAAMQAIGSYDGGRMLFLGLGTGLGTVLILEGVVQPLEIAHLHYRKGRTFEELAGKAAQRRFGKKLWRKVVVRIIEDLSGALLPDYVVVGGGEAKNLKELPPNCRLGANANAFEGGFKMWGPAGLGI